MYQTRMKDAIEAIKKGEMIIIMDDEDRENEGDLVMAGIFSTPEKINFMAQEARGLICVSITQELAHKLDLPPMVKRNDSNHETAFTISIDAKEAKTGISAYERDLTIRLMCDNNAKPSDFVRPGHIFPLIAKSGGTLIRTGHTEASVDICRLAGLSPISVICEIMKKDGTMAGRGDKFLLDFAKIHNLKILYVSDIIQYRLNFENLVRETLREKAEFMGQKCEKITFLDHLEMIHDFPYSLPNTYNLYYVYPDRTLNHYNINHTRYDEVMDGRDTVVFDYCKKIAELGKMKGTEFDISSRINPDYNVSNPQAAATVYADNDVHAAYLVELVLSIITNANEVALVMIKNNGICPNLDSEMMLEVACRIGKEEIVPLHYGDVPAFEKGLLENQFACEKLLVDAIFEQNAQKLLQAFTENRIVRDADLAKKLIARFTEANKELWPTFK